jgi:hypothetical protein
MNRERKEFVFLSLGRASHGLVHNVSVQRCGRRSYVRLLAFRRRAKLIGKGAAQGRFRPSSLTDSAGRSMRTISAPCRCPRRSRAALSGSDRSSTSPVGALGPSHASAAASAMTRKSSSVVRACPLIGSPSPRDP